MKLIVNQVYNRSSRSTINNFAESLAIPYTAILLVDSTFYLINVLKAIWKRWTEKIV